MELARPPHRAAREAVPMYFEQFYLGCLAHASYMLGSEGEAAVVGPPRGLENYPKDPDDPRLKNPHIFETPLHADFVSCPLELAAPRQAKMHISAEPGRRM